MLGELIPVGGGDAIPLLRARLLIGRRSRCDICLDFPNISSQHCELELESGYWQVRDLRSTNGVKVNGQLIEVQALMPGDRLTIGRLEFEVVYTPAADGPPPVIGEEDPFSRSLLEKAGLESRRRKRRRSGQRSRPLPPAAQPLQEGVGGGEDDGDTEVLDWLTEDDVSE